MKKSKKILSISLLLLLISASGFAKPKYISPNSDGVQDELVIPLKISDKRYVQGWSLVIMDANHKVVRTIGNKVALPEKVGFKSFFKQLVTSKQGVEIPESITWNGAMNNGETAPDGKYFYYISAIDDNGNEGKTKEYEVIVDTIAPDVTLVQPADKIFGEGSKSAFKIRQEGSLEDEWVGTFKSADGSVVKTVKWQNAEPAEFNWYGTDDEEAQLPDGVYSYEITATDRAGNQAPQTNITNIIYSAEKPATNIYVDGSRYFSPKTSSKIQNVIFNITIPVPEAKTGNKLVEWALSIEDKKGNVVRQYNQNNVGALPPETIVFDGTDEKGNKLADGEYQASVTAKYLNGYVPAKISSPIIVLDTEKPSAQIVASDKVFGAGSKDSVTFSIMIAPSAGAPVDSWKGEIRTSDGATIVKSYDFGAYPPEKIVWNGLNDKGQIADKGAYKFIMTATDLAGNLGGGELGQAVTFDTTEAQLLLAMSDTAFSPNGNKVKDTITFNPVTATKDVVSYEFTIKNAKGTVVYRSKVDSNLPASFVWDGKDNDKILAADGMYTAQLSITSANGSSASAATQAFELDTVAPSLTTEAAWTAFAPNGNGKQKDYHLQFLIQVQKSFG